MARRYAAAVQRAYRSLSLRARLILGVIVLAAVGLAIADVVTYTSLRSFLVARVDRNIAGSAEVFARSVSFHARFDVGELQQLASSVPGVYIGGRSGSEVLWRGVASRPGERLAPAPRQLPTGTPNDQEATFELGAVRGSTRYRVRLEPFPPGSPLEGQALLVAAPLTDVQSTLRRLLLIELLVTVAVLGGIAAIGLWVVRLGLRPLDRMGETAAAIAAGDLSRRVEPADERTEVGRLGLALNAMLGQIERAFHAQEASERKLRRFVADASHELRTPLAAVRAYAELFSRGASQRPQDLARTMAGISRESERMSVLVEDLLLLARLDEGRPLEQAPVDLEQVVAEAVETARTVDPDRSIELDVAPARVLGDRDRLRQVVDNLLGNVRAHTAPATPVHVTVGSRNGDALIEVSDSGPGMSADQLAHVFERFYRGDSSRSRQSGGVGLGLSIVAAVAAAHGGEASAASEPGNGSTFEVRLPLLRADLTAAAPM
jgi:two-component system OmpR family sensor kinase